MVSCSHTVAKLQQCILETELCCANVGFLFAIIPVLLCAKTIQYSLQIEICKDVLVFATFAAYLCSHLHEQI